MSYIKVKRCSTYTHFKREYKSKTCISPLSYRIVPAQSLSFSFSLSTHSLYTHSFRLFRLSLSLFPYSFFLSLALFSHFPLFLSHCTHPFQSPSYPTLSTIPPLSLNISLPYTFTSYLTYPSLSLFFPLSLIRLFVFLTEISFSQPNLSLSVSLTQAISLTPVLSFSPTLSLIPTLSPNNLLLSLFYFNSVPILSPHALSTTPTPFSLTTTSSLSLPISDIHSLLYHSLSIPLSLYSHFHLTHSHSLTPSTFSSHAFKPTYPTLSNSDSQYLLFHLSPILSLPLLHSPPLSPHSYLHTISFSSLFLPLQLCHSHSLSPT